MIKYLQLKARQIQRTANNRKKIYFFVLYYFRQKYNLKCFILINKIPPTSILYFSDHINTHSGSNKFSRRHHRCPR